MIMNSGWNVEKIMWNRKLPIFLEIHVVCRLRLEGINWQIKSNIQKKKKNNNQKQNKKQRNISISSAARLAPKKKHICSWVLEVWWAKCLLRTSYLNLSLNSGFLAPEVMEWIQSSRFIFSYLFEVIFIFPSILHVGGSPQTCWTGSMRDTIHCTEMHQSLCLRSRLSAAERSRAEWSYTRSDSDHAAPCSPPLGLL